MGMGVHDLKRIGLSAAEYGLVEPGHATTVAYGARNLNWKGKLSFYFRMQKARRRLEQFYRNAMASKECYYGPFKGEFGHFLLHNLPFLTHLHRSGVRIHYCGMELHKPFLVDENGESILESALWLRDFFHEVKPSANATVPPTDVIHLIEGFKKKARSSGKAFLDIDDNDLYWFVFRNWQLQGKQSVYNLSAQYGSGKGNTCVIFPRKKGGDFSPNNGGPWDYMEIARKVSPYFDKVFLVGHPSLSTETEPEGNIEVRISENNADTLAYCADAELIITQHSGAVHMGAYVNTPVLIIFNGPLPIRGLIDTIRFRVNLTHVPLNYAFSLDEIENFVAAAKQ